jgi:hypothetical protein
VDYEAVFLKEDGTANGVMKEMMDGIVGILKWINTNVDDDDELHHAGVKARVQHCISEWKKKATDQKASRPPGQISGRTCKSRLWRVSGDDCIAGLLSWEGDCQGTQKLEQPCLSSCKPWSSSTVISFQGQE